MKLPTEVFGDVVVVHTPDEFGGDGAELLTEHVQSLCQQQIVLDIDGTELLDSAGLTAMLDVREQLQQQMGDLKVSTSNHSNRKILEVTRLDTDLEVYDSVIDAVKSFR